MQSLIDALCQRSDEFAAMWRNSEVRSHGAEAKHLEIPPVGELALELSSFSIYGRPELNMGVWTPATCADAERIEALVEIRTQEHAYNPSLSQQ